METLKEISIALLAGESVRSGSSDYVLKEINTVSGGFKAILTSHGYRYSNHEPAETKEIAIYQALIGLQAMGRFLNYRTEESIQAAEKAKAKKPKPLKPEKIKEDPKPVVQEEPEEPETIPEQEPVSGSPEEIELRTIIKIVTRMT